MKKLFLALMAVAAIALTGCKDSKDEPTPQKDVKVTEINPNPVKAGQELTISGENLDLVTKVTFAEGVEVTTFKSQSNEQIVIANFPARAQTGKIAMSYVAAGDTTAKQFLSDIELNVVLPSVPQVYAFTEVTGSQHLTIDGKDLDLVTDAVTSVGDTLDFMISNEGAKMEITMPEVVTNCVINVFAASGIAVPVATISVVLPKVASVEDNTDVREGSEVVINGTDMAIVSAINFVDIKGNAITVDGDGIYVTDTKVVVAVPAMAISGAMVIKTTANIDVEDEKLTIETLKPEVTAFNPAEVDMGGTVALNGTNLDLVKTVTLTGGAVLTPADADETTFNITIPYADAETGSVILTMANGETVETDVELTINKAEPKRSLWKGALPISWSDEGKIHILASAMADVPAGAELVLCYTQIDQTWGQANVVNGKWGKYPNLTNPDGTKILNGEGSLVPTDIYGWFSDGILYRETPIVLTDELLTDLRANVDDNGNILHIQGQDLIFNEIYVRWTISL